SQGGAIQLGIDTPTQKRLELPKAVILAPRVAEVVGCIERRGDSPGRVHRQALVHQQLTESRPAAGLPVVVVASQIGDQTAELALTPTRSVTNGVRQLLA